MWLHKAIYGQRGDGRNLEKVEGKVFLVTKHWCTNKQTSHENTLYIKMNVAKYMFLILFMEQEL